MRNLSPTLWSVVAVEDPSVDAGDRFEHRFFVFFSAPTVVLEP